MDPFTIALIVAAVASVAAGATTAVQASKAQKAQDSAQASMIRDKRRAAAIAAENDQLAGSQLMQTIQQQFGNGQFEKQRQEAENVRADAGKADLSSLPVVFGPSPNASLSVQSGFNKEIGDALGRSSTRSDALAKLLSVGDVFQRQSIGRQRLGENLSLLGANSANALSTLPFSESLYGARVNNASNPWLGLTSSTLSGLGRAGALYAGYNYPGTGSTGTGGDLGNRQSLY